MFFCAIAGGACLLSVAGVFVLVLVATENPQWWDETARTGGQLPVIGSVHWLLRLAHIYGAATVIAALFHLALTPSSALDKRKALTWWLTGGILFQFVGGIGLYASLPRSPSFVVVLFVLLAAGTAAFLLWGAQRSKTIPGISRRRSFLGLGALLLILMLVVRQLLQEKVLLPVSIQLARNAEVHQARLNQFRFTHQVQDSSRPGTVARGEALALFPGSEESPRIVAPRDSAAVMFLQSCSFCHNGVANGQGEEASRLKVPPENLNAMRITPGELRRILLDGVPGTAMPRFGFYTGEELDRISEFLLTQTGFRHELASLVSPVNSGAASAALRVFSIRCAACHGPAGRGSDLGHSLVPPVPNLTQLTLAPQRTFDIISQGYPGTLMPAFSDHSEEVRWELVRIAHSLYEQPGRGPAMEH